MPKVVNINGDPGMSFAYVVTTSVGVNCSNTREDVMLVQYLLQGIYGHPAQFTPPPKPVPGKSIKPDGFVGPITIRHIDAFQKELLTRGKSVMNDQRVDPPLSPNMIGTISGKQYTIFHLNAAFKKARPEAFKNIMLDAECPPELGLAVGLVIIPDPDEVPEDSL